MDKYLLVIIIVLIVILYINLNPGEHMDNFPFAFLKSYVNDLEPSSVRLLDESDMKYREPPYSEDVRDRYYVRDNSIPSFN